MTTRDWSPLHQPGDNAPREAVGSDALARLLAFRQEFHAEDLIDEQSGLTAADLDTVIAMATRQVP
jgi:hypothetical protein